MNQAQAKAVERLRRAFERQVEHSNSYSTCDATKRALKFEVDDRESGRVWVTIDVDYPNSKGTLLSALNDDHWFISVGERGALRAFSYPKSCNQFRGRKVNFLAGVNIMRNR